MMTFRFEQYWHAETCCEVEANSIEEALEKVKNDDCEWIDNTNNNWPESAWCQATDEEGMVCDEWQLDVNFNIVSD